MNNKIKGFTLVEVAIVLVIIGLIVGAVLKGSVLIESAKYKTFLKSITDYQEMVGKFQEKYNALPGDIADVKMRISNSLVAGNSNGRIQGVSEEKNFWLHLVASGLASGDYSSDPPHHPYPGDGKIKVHWRGAPINKNCLEINGIPALVAKRLDRDIDDEDPTKGSVIKGVSTGCVSGGKYKNDDTLCTIDIFL